MISAAIRCSCLRCVNGNPSYAVSQYNAWLNPQREPARGAIEVGVPDRVDLAIAKGIVLIVRWRERSPRHDDAPLIVNRQRPQQHALPEGEDHGGARRADPKRGDGREAEPLGAPQAAAREQKIVEQPIGHADPPGQGLNSFS